MDSNLNELRNINDRLKSVISRYNELTKGFDEIEVELNKRDEQTATLKSEVVEYSDVVKNDTEKINRSIEKVQRARKNLTSDFKSILKQDQYAKLERRINSLKFEEFMSRNEFYRYLDRFL